MKYYLFAGLIIVAGAGAVLLSKSQSISPVDKDHFAAKRKVAEVETKVRPAQFENMKWNPEEAIEMRAPASTDK